MKLYLVQHAEPKQEEEDLQKPLSDEGWSDIRKVAAFVARHADVHVGSIMHSGKTRAQQTAETLGEYLKLSEGIKEADALQPLADPATWAEQLSEIMDDIMLVGHLPHLSKLAAYLVCNDEERRVIDFQMGGIVCLQRDESGTWAVHWMVTPSVVG